MSANSNAKLLMQFHADLDKLPRTEDNWRLKIAYKALADLFDLSYSPLVGQFLA